MEAARTVLSDVGLQCDLFHQVRRRTRVLAVASANVAPSRGAAARLVEQPDRRFH
jgi:hypothetical protein